MSLRRSTTSSTVRGRYDPTCDPLRPVPWEPTTDERTSISARAAVLRWPALPPTRVLAGCQPVIPWRPGLTRRDVPGNPDAPFHASVFPRWWACAPEAERPYAATWPHDECPVCAGRLGPGRRQPRRVGWAELGATRLPIFAQAEPTWTEKRTHCLWCDGRSPDVEYALSQQRKYAERDRQEREIAAAVRQSDRDALLVFREDAQARCDKDGVPRQAKRLTELERRRIWQGYRGPVRVDPGAVDVVVRDGEIIPREPSERALTGRAFLRAIGQVPDWTKILDGQGREIGRYVWDGTRWTAQLSLEADALDDSLDRAQEFTHAEPATDGA